MNSSEWQTDQAFGEAALRRLEKLPSLRASALRQIAKACRDVRRNSNLDDSPDVRSFLEEIEKHLDGLDL